MEGFSLYVLSLENGKYYVGTSDNIETRILDHFSNDGSEWTKKYQPLKVIETIKNCDRFDEDKYTKIYMQKYGIENVRGGSYCQIKLSRAQYEILEKELNTASNACFKCGETGHYANRCRTKIIESSSESESNDSCFRCGRAGHYANRCYAKKDIDGNDIESSSESEIISIQSSKTSRSKNNSSITFIESSSESESDDSCYRCGRTGHYANCCYAKKDIDGNHL